MNPKNVYFQKHLVENGISAGKVDQLVDSTAKETVALKTGPSGLAAAAPSKQFLSEDFPSPKASKTATSFDQEKQNGVQSASGNPWKSMFSINFLLSLNQLMSSYSINTKQSS